MSLYTLFSPTFFADIELKKSLVSDLSAALAEFYALQEQSAVIPHHQSLQQSHAHPDATPNHNGSTVPPNTDHIPAHTQPDVNIVQHHYKKDENYNLENLQNNSTRQTRHRLLHIWIKFTVMDVLQCRRS